MRPVETSSVRVEKAERTALADLHLAARSRREPDAADRLGLALDGIGGALVSVASRDPSIVVNRVVGLGMTRPVGSAEVARLVARYAEAGVDRYYVHLDPAAREADRLAERFEAAGLGRHRRAWAKFARGPETVERPGPVVRSDLVVRRIGADLGAEFGRIACRGFGLEEAWIPALARLAGLPGWQVYLSFDGDVPAGCGAMRIVDGIAWFDWAATLPEFRRRGSQGAILAKRIADATRLGCHTLATCTGEELPGEPQYSYRNLERAGFRRTHARENWVPEGVSDPR
jgi:hypothetical protein